ncbi:MAG: holo-ACP synthase [Ilumatobacteraceae bacterium]
MEKATSVGELVRAATADATNECGSDRFVIGVDLVEVADVAASIRVHGERYLDRVFTSAEVATCTDDSGGYVVDRLAARFAAKEAAIKALRHDGGVQYRDVETVLDHTGAPHLVLHGSVSAHAGRAGVSSQSISLSHSGGYAVAVVLLQMATDAKGSDL